MLCPVDDAVCVVCPVDDAVCVVCPVDDAAVCVVCPVDNAVCVVCICTYVHNMCMIICVLFDFIDQTFEDMIVRDSEFVAVEVVAKEKKGSYESIIFQGSVRYESLKKTYDNRVSSLVLCCCDEMVEM